MTLGARPLDTSRVAAALGIPSSRIPHDWRAYVADQGLREVSGSRRTVTFESEPWMITEGLDIFRASGGCLPFARELSGSVFFYDTAGRIDSREPWSVGLQLDRAPSSDGLRGVLRAGRSATEVIGATLAGYGTAGSPGHAPLVPVRSRVPERHRSRAREALARLPLRIDRLREQPLEAGLDGEVWIGRQPGWRLHPAPGTDALRRLHDDFPPAIADVLAALYENAAAVTLMIDVMHWIHVEHIDALVSPPEGSGRFGRSAPGLARIASVRGGTDEIVLFLAMVGAGAGTIVGCHAHALGTSSPVAHPLGERLDEAIGAILEAWSRDGPVIPH